MRRRGRWTSRSRRDRRERLVGAGTPARRRGGLAPARTRPSHRRDHQPPAPAGDAAPGCRSPAPPSPCAAPALRDRRSSMSLVAGAVIGLVAGLAADRGWAPWSPSSPTTSRAARRAVRRSDPARSKRGMHDDIRLSVRSLSDGDEHRPLRLAARSADAGGARDAPSPRRMRPPSRAFLPARLAARTPRARS